VLASGVYFWIPQRVILGDDSYVKDISSMYFAVLLGMGKNLSTILVF
jgi:hypothetical protein